jgi:hypothetical protein
MRTFLPILVCGLTSLGAVATAQTPSDRIRALYDEVPYELVRASPEADIVAHIREMGRRKSLQDNAFAVPDVDIETLLRDRGQEDVLMDPRVLEAIARMPPGRAAEVLRQIEERRAGPDPLQDIPPLSLEAQDLAPDSLALKGWVLERDASGAPYMQLGSDVASRIMIVPSMILGDLGRVISVQDDDAAFRVTLETGDSLEGDLRVLMPETTEIPGEIPLPADEGEGLIVEVGMANADTIRPRARPEGLRSPVAVAEVVTVSDAAATGASTGDQTVQTPTIRPKQRPAGLGGGVDIPPSEAQ